MLYENYQKKMNKIAEVLAKLLRILPLLIAAVLAILATVIALLASKGSVSRFYCKEEAVYGSEPECSAKAFLSKVRYEYAYAGSNDWVEGLPKMPGTYSVRAVGRTIFGTDRYSDADTVTILPRSMTVYAAKNMEYGNHPTILADALVNGDRIVCENFMQAFVENPEASDTNNVYMLDVTPDIKAVSVFDEDGNDVTSAYIIQARAETVSVKRRELSVLISDVSKIYDGTPLFSELYEYKNGSLLMGDSAVFEFTASLTDVGETENLPGLKILNAANEDVTDFYNISVQPGKLTVEKRPVFITTGSTSVYYSGNNVDCFDFTCDPQHAPIAGHEIVPIDNRPLIDAGTYANTLRFSILDGNGNDVSGNYELTVTEGTITILPLPLRVQTGDVTYQYDAQPKYGNHEYTVSGDLAEGHVHKPSGEIFAVNAGVYKNEISIVIEDPKGQDVTSNYAIDYLYGQLTITKMPIKVITHDMQWVYNGMNHDHFSYTLEGFKLSEEDYIVQSPDFPPIKYVGSIENAFTVKISNKDTLEDITENFDITYQYGILTVTKRPISFQTGSRTWLYDGQEHVCTDYVVQSELDLADGDSFVVTASTTLKNVVKASVPNVWESYDIVDGNGNSVLDQYEILQMTNGMLRIEPRPIQIKPVDAEKIYDGLPLVPTDWEKREGSTYFIADGHTLVVGYTGSQTDAGQSASKITGVVIYDEEHVDVTENYSISLFEGTLLVKPRPIKIKPVDEKKVYDATSLLPQSWEYVYDTPYQLLDGHGAVVQYAGNRVNAGTAESNIISVVIMNGTVDVTSNYDITALPGLLEVARRPMEIKPVDKEKVYDGKVLVPTDWEYTEKTEYLLVEGHTMTAKYNGSILLPGQKRSGIQSVTVMSGPTDVSSNYDVSGVQGLLTITGEQNDNGVEDKENQAPIKIGSIKSSVSEAIYLRETSYAYYDGRNYIHALPYDKKLPGGYTYDYLTSLAIQNAGYTAYTAELKDMWVYLLPYYRGEGTYPAFDSDTTYGKAVASSYELQYYSVPVSEYKFLQGKLDSSLVWAEMEYRRFVYDSYLSMDDEMRAYMDQIIEEQQFDNSDPDIVMKIASYIQNAATYNLNFDRAMEQEDNIVIAFLETYKEGVCRHYASAATFLYRALGIPARYTQGYLVQNVKAGEFVDIMTPGHAWVEVYMDGIGWMAVEVTGGSGGGGGVGSGGGGGGGGGGEGTEPPKDTKIEIQPEYQQKIYDRRPLNAVNRIEGNALLNSLLEQGYTYAVSVSGSQTAVGLGESTITSFKLFDPSGKDVTSEYDIRYIPGILEVFPADQEIIPVYLYQLQQFYNGKPLAFEEGDYEIEMPDGYRVNLKLNISLTEVGELTLSTLNANISKYVSTFNVYESDTMEEVTSDYRIVFEADSAVPIKVDPRGITLISESETKVYDGTPLSNGNVFISIGSLANGHRLEYQTSGSITAPGRSPNIISSVVIFDAAGNDVTKNYDITQKYGILEIIPVQ